MDVREPESKTCIMMAMDSRVATSLGKDGKPDWPMIIEKATQNQPLCEPWANHMAVFVQKLPKGTLAEIDSHCKV